MLATLMLAAATLDPLLAEYAADTVGLYSSAAQHRADAAYDEVEARVVRIWPERTDGVWLYQEQTIVNQPGLSPDDARAKPYFQRVARVVMASDATLRRDNYRLKAPAPHVGAARLAELTPDSLVPAGCHNIIQRIGTGTWYGMTENCANSYKGAASMVSQSVKTPGRFVNWDRGLAADGSHVWGPRAGGYVFDRVAD
jgi:hypothetical protein